MNKPIRIFSSDILIADVIVNLEGNGYLQELVKRYGLKPGGKAPLSKQQFEELSAAIDGYPVTITPGGSAANTLTTLSRLMEDEVDVTFMGVTGGSMYSKMIKEALGRAKVNLIPNKVTGDIRPESAVSFVIVYPDGQRTIATYPGNAKDLLKPELISGELIDKNDVMFLQGSLWQKLGSNFPDKIMNECWKKGKELWLALPTHAKFGKEKADLFQWLVPSANLILGNDDELARIYKTTPEDALNKLHETFKHNKILEKKGMARRRQVGFITMGEYGAAVVTEDGVIQIDPLAVNPENIKNTVGAGDTAFAGFALGYLKGLPHDISAKVAMTLAGEKLRYNQARLPEPKAILAYLMPSIHQQLFAKSQSGSH